MIKDFKDMLQVIGAFLVSVAIMAVPILVTCSFIYSWYSIIKYLLVIMCVIEFGWLMITTLYISEEN